MHKFARMLVAALSLALVAAGAHAEGFMPWTKVLEMADTDGDGMVSAKEIMYFDAADHYVGFQPFMTSHFRDFDTNGDGMVTMEESKAAVARLGMSEAEMSEAFFKQQGFMPRSAN